MVWLTNWNYRKTITISNAGSTLSDYQVLITTDTATLISAGKMQSDCRDIRFTDDDGSTLLSYWIESGQNTASTKIWVKIPSIPTSKTIYLYYNNPTATSTASSYQSFWLITNGDFESNVTFPEPVVGFTKAWTGNQSGYGIYTGPYGEDARNPDRTPIQGTYALQNRIGSWDWTGTTWYYQDVSLPNEDNIIIEMLAASGFKQNNGYGSIDIIENAGTGASHNIWPTSNGGNIPWGWISYNVSPYKNTTVRLKILTGAGGGALGRDYNLFVDFIRIRKYTSPEPTFSISGTDETPPNITATSMTTTPSETPCRVGICTVTVNVTWTNNGGSSGDFIPNITIDGTPYSSPYPLQSLGSGLSVIKTFVISGLVVDTHSICPYPN